MTKNGGVLLDRIRTYADSTPEKVAFFGLNHHPVTFGELAEICERLIFDLRSFGIRKLDRVAVLVEDRFELAIAITAVGCGAACFPLNFNSPPSALLSLMRQAGVAVLISTEKSNLVKSLLSDSDFRYLQLVVNKDQSSDRQYRLASGKTNAENHTDVSRNDDPLFVLATSGTTLKPKIVSLSHTNILTSAINTASSLQFDADDRLLSVMPLHHAHGLISGLMSSLCFGCSTIVMEEFATNEFPDILCRYEPTWITAVPTILRALLEQTHKQPKSHLTHKLKLIRSASSPLSQDLMNALENQFNVPVIETYGMTEAASQIAANPLPPHPRKSGSVGLAAGPELRIVGQEGQILGPQIVGEIQLIGPNVAKRYDDQKQTENSYTRDGWFKTGDLGYLDSDRYLFLTGRIKEMINRGGEKISPFNVERVISAHPDILEAVVFPVSHPRLGEEAVAAVTIRGNSLTPARIRSFIESSNALSQHEVPKQILILQSIPKTTTGKISRLTLAKTLGMTSQVQFRQPSEFDSVEEILSQYWVELLSIDEVGSNQNFFLLGGDSLLAIHLAMQICDRFGVSFTVADIYHAPTIKQQAKLIASKKNEVKNHPRIPIKAKSVPVTCAQKTLLENSARLFAIPIYSVGYTFRLSGALDVDAFRQSLSRVINKHVLLRSCFSKGPKFKIKVNPDVEIDRYLAVEDWSLIPEAGQMALVSTLLENDSSRSFDLANGPLVRLRLLKFSEDHFILFLNIHHVITDGWSMDMLFGDLSDYYNLILAGFMPGGELGSQGFLDFARLQNAWCESDTGRQMIARSAQRINNCRPLLQPENGTKHRLKFCSQYEQIQLQQGIYQKLLALARREKCTIFIILLTCLARTFRRLDNSGEFSFLFPAANRSSEGIANVFGLVENTVLATADISANSSFQDGLKIMRAAISDAMQFEAVPFEASLALARQSNLPDLYVSLAFDFTKKFLLKNILVESQNIENQGHPKSPAGGASMMFMLNETNATIVGTCAYDDRVVDERRAKTIVEDFLGELRKVANS